METRHRFYAAPARSAAGLPDSPSEAMPRDDARVTVFTIAGMVFMEGLSEPWWCTVRDMSHGGARLERLLERAQVEDAEHLSLIDGPLQAGHGEHVREIHKGASHARHGYARPPWFHLRDVRDGNGARICRAVPGALWAR